MTRQIGVGCQAAAASRPACYRAGGVRVKASVGVSDAPAAGRSGWQWRAAARGSLLLQHAVVPMGGQAWGKGGEPAVCNLPRVCLSGTECTSWVRIGRVHTDPV